MRVLGAAVCGLLAAGLVAGAAWAGPDLLGVAAALLVVLVALGWGSLLALPRPAGTGLLVLASGAAAVVAARVVQGRGQPLSVLAGVLAISVLLAFGFELVRGDGRVGLVESVTGGVCGQVCALLAGGWLLLPGSVAGRTSALSVAAAAAVAFVVVSLPVPNRPATVVAMLLGAAASAGVAQPFDPGRPVSAAITGALVALLAACGALLVPAALVPGTTFARRAGAMLAAGAAPLAVSGTITYAVARLVQG